MNSDVKSNALSTPEHAWYLRLLADSLVIVTFCGLAVALATSFAVAA